jgi:hypothetical protein
MSPDKHRTIPPNERAAEAVRHSAFEEFRRDERRPAMLLLAALVIAALFFALGIMIGRWMADDKDAPATRRTQPETLNASPAPVATATSRP